MQLKIEISPNVSKRLKALRRGGGNASQAAEHAAVIINRAIEGISSPQQLGRLTMCGGDARIANCIKFDLVGGYRLVAVTGRGHIGFLFVGSHDECDHWVKNNAGFELKGDGGIRPASSQSRAGNSEGQFRVSRDRQEKIREEGPCEEIARTDDYDASLLRELSESDLRKIFCGICGKRA